MLDVLTAENQQLRSNGDLPIVYSMLQKKSLPTEVTCQISTYS